MMFGARPITFALFYFLFPMVSSDGVGELTWWTGSEPGPLQGSSCEYAQPDSTALGASWLSPYVDGGMYCAVSDDLFNGGEGCGKCYRITYTSGGSNAGQAQPGSADIQVVNSGAGGFLHFDCFDTAHQAITGISTGIHPVSYTEIPCTNSPPSVVILDGPNAYYVKVLVAGGRTGVKAVKVYLDGNAISMNRNSGATWAAGLAGVEGLDVEVSFEVTFSDNTVTRIENCFDGRWPVHKSEQCSAQSGTSFPTKSPVISPTDEAPTEAPFVAEPAPQPTESPSPSLFDNCFSSRNTVIVEGKGETPLHKLEIGDYVQTPSKKFSRVYSFLHHDDDRRAQFLRIHTLAETIPLEVTASHMLFSGNDVVRASDVKVGDVLNEGKTVRMIELVDSNGLYAPVTESGELIVSGIGVSSYVATFDGISPWLQHTLGHAVMYTRRQYCLSRIQKCQAEQYIGGFPAFLHKYLPAIESAAQRSRSPDGIVWFTILRLLRQALVVATTL